MRIGIRLAPEATSGAAFVAGREVARSSLEGSSEAALRDVLGGLAKETAKQQGRSALTVAFDLDGILAEHVVRMPHGPELGPVLLVLVAPRPPSHPALLRHPDPLVAGHVGTVVPVRGGHTVRGVELAPLDEDAVREIASGLRAGEYGDIRDVAVVAAGALASPEHERRIAEAFIGAVDGVRVSTSCDFGGVGFTERACSTVLNASLTRHADPLVTRCEHITRDVMGEVPIGFARGDGGRLLAPRMRAFPVTGLRASVACVLSGAARAYDLSDCRVLLCDDGRLHQGEVVAGLPVSLPERPFTTRTRLSVPTPKLGEVAPASVGALLSDAEVQHVVAVDEEAFLAMALDPAGAAPPARVDDEAAALLGLAHCEPMAYIDEIAAVGGADEVRRARSDAEQRALVMAVSAGGEPGTERIVESSVMGVPYGGAATVRLRVRATCGLPGE